MLVRILPTLLFYCLFVIGFSGCLGETKRVDQKTFEEAIKEHEIKQVSDAELYEAAQTLGDSIVRHTQQKLGSNLMMAYQKGGPEAAIPFCNLQAYPLVDTLQQRYNAIIRRVSFKTRNPKNTPDSLEADILAAYQYNHEKGLPLEPNIQRTSNQTQLLYTRPLLIDNAFCLNCHGEPGDNLKTETLELIRNLYPADSAIHYQVGDLRGMWSIKLSVKQLVKDL